MSSELYQEIILDYYRHPRNFGTIKKADAKARDVNTACGDEIEMTIKLDSKKRIQEILFNGKGCAISQAAASMLTETVKGMTLDEARNFSKDEMRSLLGIPVSGMRLKCALLGLKVFKMAVYTYLGIEYDRASEDD